jgi:Uroporphyrinogen decarboxylase (URO-D)
LFFMTAATVTSTANTNTNTNTNINTNTNTPLATALLPEEDHQRPSPLLLRAARGQVVEQTPVWMMRQAGRHMQAYRDMLQEFPTFRERSEIPRASLAISLQPFHACTYDVCVHACMHACMHTYIHAIRTCVCLVGWKIGKRDP